MKRIDLEDLIHNYNYSDHISIRRQMLNHPAIRSLSNLLKKKVQEPDYNWFLPTNLDDFEVLKCFLDNPTQPGHQSHRIFLKIIGKITLAPDTQATAEIFTKLYSKANEDNMLSRKTYECIKNHPQLPDIAWALHIVCLSGIGKVKADDNTAGYRKDYHRFEEPIVKHDKPRELAKALYHLYSKGLLTPACDYNLELVANCGKPRRMAEHIEKLSTATLPVDFPKVAFGWALVSLINNGLDSEQNCAALINHPSAKDICSMIRTFDQQAKILNQDSLAFVLKHKDLAGLQKVEKFFKDYPYKPAHKSPAPVGAKRITPQHNHKPYHGSPIYPLWEDGVLTKYIVDAVNAHPDPLEFETLVNSLYAAALLSPDNIKNCASLLYPREFNQALGRLSKAECFNDHVRPDLRSSMLDGLIQYAKSIDQHILDIRCKLEKPDEAGETISIERKPGYILGATDEIIILFKAGIYNLDNFSTATSIPNKFAKLMLTSTSIYGEIATTLNAAGILTNANIRRIVGIGENPHSVSFNSINNIYTAIFSIHKASLLNQTRLYQLMSDKYRWLRSWRARDTLWRRLPAHLLNADVFNTLLFLSVFKPYTHSDVRCGGFWPDGEATSRHYYTHSAYYNHSETRIRPPDMEVSNYISILLANEKSDTPSSRAAVNNGASAQADSTEIKTAGRNGLFANADDDSKSGDDMQQRQAPLSGQDDNKSAQHSTNDETAASKAPGAGS